MIDMVDYTLKAMDEKHMLSIILYIYSNKGVTKGMIYQNVGMSPRMNVKLDILKDLGLITIEGAVTKHVALTEKGMRMAELISQMEDVLSSD